MNGFERLDNALKLALDFNDLTSSIMKYSRFLTLLTLPLCLLLTCCSKGSDPFPHSCNFTFKGKAYSFSDVTCVKDFVLFGYHTGTFLTATATVTQNFQKFPQKLKLREGSIYFDSDSLDAQGINYPYNSSDVPIVSISGDKWTFSGTLLINIFPDSIGVRVSPEKIEGTCICNTF